MIFGYHNLWIYNTFLLVQLPLILRLIHSMTWSKGLRTWGKWLLALRIIVTLGEIGTKSFTEELYNSTALLDGTIVTGLFVVLLFTLSNEDLEPIYHSPKFWVALAFVLFYGPTIPLYGLITYLTERNVRLASQLYVINDILFILFYSILIMVLSRMIPAGMKVIKHVG